LAFSIFRINLRSKK